MENHKGEGNTKLRIVITRYLSRRTYSTFATYNVNVCTENSNELMEKISNQSTRYVFVRGIEERSLEQNIVVWQVDCCGVHVD